MFAMKGNKTIVYSIPSRQLNNTLLSDKIEDLESLSVGIMTMEQSST